MAVIDLQRLGMQANLGPRAGLLCSRSRMQHGNREDMVEPCSVPQKDIQNSATNADRCNVPLPQQVHRWVDLANRVPSDILWALLSVLPTVVVDFL